jgi:membrane protein implicated in regulation of membrane protease activity
MGEEKSERPYPLKSLHDFLTELDREWNKFKMGSLIGIITSGALLLFLVRLILLQLARPPRLILDMDLLFLIFAAIFLIYSMYALFAQYRFLRRWERRIGLLLHLEEQLIGEKLEEKDSE